ncbi:hypothetical protein NP493_88g03026 [Ridgeia piscesae]|uniref:Uncharacterized protein n=1 Tax=Ridgeia piscesae TaxID=27915 RepID=A0AAD9UI18_RIDPI|nr:hypothetical protein NP493_88g03026 [Ridgeia piscesae]
MATNGDVNSDTVPSVPLHAVGTWNRQPVWRVTRYALCLDSGQDVPISHQCRRYVTNCNKNVVLILLVLARRSPYALDDGGIWPRLPSRNPSRRARRILASTIELRRFEVGQPAPVSRQPTATISSIEFRVSWPRWGKAAG